MAVAGTVPRRSSPQADQSPAAPRRARCDGQPQEAALRRPVLPEGVVRPEDALRTGAVRLALQEGFSSCRGGSVQGSRDVVRETRIDVQVLQLSKTTPSFKIFRKTELLLCIGEKTVVVSEMFGKEVVVALIGRVIDDPCVSSEVHLGGSGECPAWSRPGLRHPNWSGNGGRQPAGVDAVLGSCRCLHCTQR